MAHQAVVTFDRIRFRLGLRVSFAGNKVFVGLPIVRHYVSDPFVFDGIPEPPSRFGVAAAQHAVDELSSMAIDSNPYPTVFFFDPT